jgi:hypothetical protein
VLLALVIVFIGAATIVQSERAFENGALDRSMARSRALVERCEPDAASAIKNALVTYLTIEDLHRPKWFQTIETGFARLTNSLGFASFQTLGVGQISYATYLRQHDRASVSDWIRATSDACQSTTILIADLRHSKCVANSTTCSFEHVCRWHAGYTDRCLSESQHRGYAVAVARLLAIRPYLFDAATQ